MDEKQRTRIECIQAITGIGQSKEFAALIADSLGSEKTMRRMIGYIRQARPRTAEEIADEMLAILDDRDIWIRKKQAEYYNQKYNELLWYGFGTDGEEEG